ncbi:MAG: beta-galactosidase [Verrucomicrobia bacterium Tous-C9LFEB]|nr:MAG: beta-galactosidase [Verrucomicrobia bacterium Tous-C9LFEB]
MALSWKHPIKDLLHGGDYNPEQWSPDVWREDIRLMKKARINCVSIGIFSWSHLEPEEGRYDFAWMDELIGLLSSNGIASVLATPSGARPPWLSQRYPEVLRVNDQGIRNLYGQRHNHCLTSPVYREKVAAINRRLAERYGANDSVILWHISNEFSGECHCDLCQSAFRDWLRRRYGTLDALNAAWWTSFWSHRYTDWNQIDAPSSRGDRVHGQNLAWQRFVTDQTVNFFNAEVAALREFDTKTPVTTNFMGAFPGLDYVEFARHLDIVSWDSYPRWHSDPHSDAAIGAETSFTHDLTRCLKRDQPFLLMESTPSQVNWQQVNKLKRPGMHQLSSLQAIAHGSDSVQYFQWRKSRGSCEKFHGAVVDHCGHENTRTFRDVTQLGETLAQLSQLPGSLVPARAAVIYDWNNRWAIDAYYGLRQDKKNYFEEVLQYYRGLWDLSISTDCVDESASLDRYQLVVAPMLYLLKPGMAEKLEAFVQRGGTLITSALTGLVDQDDLVFAGGAPGPLRKLLGLWVEETDALYDHDTVVVRPLKGLPSLQGEFAAREICERVHLETAVPLAVYGSQFYAGEPCLSENRFGQGSAYHVACRVEAKFTHALLRDIAARIGLQSNWSLPLPEGVNVQKRASAQGEFYFAMNFNPREVTLPAPAFPLRDELSGQPVTGPLSLPSYGVTVLRRD